MKDSDTSKGKEILEYGWIVLAVLLFVFNHISSLWILAGTSITPKLQDTIVNPEWKDVSRYAHSDKVAYYFDGSIFPDLNSECFAIDLYLRGFKHPKHNAYELGCYMAFPGRTDSIVKGNRLVVYLHGGDSVVAKAYHDAHPYNTLRTRRSIRTVRVQRYSDYSITKKNFFKLLNNMPDSIKVESANGQIVRPARSKAHLDLQKRYYMIEDHLSKFQYKMKARPEQ